MIKVLNIIFFVTLFLIIQGCSQEGLIEKFNPKAEIDFAKNYFSLFQSEDYKTIEESIDENLKNSDLRNNLEKIANIFPKESPKKIDIVGYRMFEMADKWQANLTFQYEFSQNWLIANIVLERIDEGPLVVKGVHVNPIQNSLQNSNKFKVKDKSIIHYIFLLLAVLIPLFIVFTFVVCLKTKIKKKKWLWVIFVLLGVIRCRINWSTGEIFCQLISFNLFGAGFFYGNQFGPAMLEVAFPLGAIIFWIKRKKYQQNIQPDSLDLAG